MNIKDRQKKNTHRRKINIFIDLLCSEFKTPKVDSKGLPE